LFAGQDGGTRKLPYAFTEHGVTMLSAVLKSETAIKASIQILKTFVAMRHFLQNNAQVFAELKAIRQHQIDTDLHLKESDRRIDELFDRMDKYAIDDTQGIFFQGQIFDAYVFASKLVRSAKKCIVLIDNYVDESVLLLLAKRKKNVSATIYTKCVSHELQQDLGKHNAQYDPIKMLTQTNVHDRFLIVDNIVYHIGASMKDLGKKLFAFSKLELEGGELLKKL
jgi:hypothetical protein